MHDSVVCLAPKTTRAATRGETNGVTIVLDHLGSTVCLSPTIVGGNVGFLYRR